MPRQIARQLRSPILRHVRSIPGRWYTRSEVATMLGISVARLRYLQGRPDLQAPRNKTLIGQTTVFLYDQDDVDEIRAYISRRPEAVPTGLADQSEADLRKQRQRLYKQRQYHRDNADMTTDPDRKARHEQRLAEIAQTIAEINLALRALRK